MNSTLTKPPRSISLVYFGTPGMALPPLTRFLEDERFRVLAVVTQTDKPSGRGQKLQSPPVKVLAESKGIPVFQPQSLKKPEKSGGLFDFLSQHPEIDFFVVVAYGKIIPGTLLSLPRFCAVNIHFSLLPDRFQFSRARSILCDGS